MSGPRDRLIDQLERELERDDLTAEERKEIHREIRDIDRAIAEEERWLEEGYEKGYL